MLYLKTRYFARWARKEGVPDSSLREAIREFKSGLFEANLGNHLFKKRIALPGRGKSGGARTILFYQQEEKLVFCFGFAKNVQEDLYESDKKVLDRLVKDLLGFHSADLDKYIQLGALIKITETEGEK
ncbi:MAG: hypothetical protein A2Z88_09410 [Omnitrophica WOR_2 bacterium GWA2_47_8]|nr:MAG: hypothetical protein A2Z88_09410 [Omnitrophica WOR_2 bacterium GWA2_47_8]